MLDLAELDAEIAGLMGELADLQAQTSEAGRPASQVHAANQAKVVKLRIADLENIIARSPARSLEDAAIQIRRVLVMGGDQATARMLGSALEAVEAAAQRI